MALVLMATHGWGTLWADPDNLVAAAGQQASFTNIADATAVTHYADDTGGSPSTGPVTADANGRLMRWIEEGAYIQALPGGTTLEVQAVSGATLASVESRVAEGTGTPEGVITAQPGTLYTDRTNGTYWWKYAGTGNTGWAPNLPAGSVRADAFAGTATVKLRAAFAAASVIGGLVICDRAAYSVDLSDGSPLFDFPVDKRVEIIGAGVSVTSTSTGTKITRSAGTAPIIRAIGTGQTSSTRCLPAARNLQLHGGATSGDVVYLERCNEVDFEHVRIGNATGHALKLIQVWNSHFTRCFFGAAGAGTATPAVLVDSIDDPGESATVTVHFSDCEWEGNTGTDIKLTGSRAEGRPANGLMFTNTKIEDIEVGRTWPALDLDFCQAVQFANLTIDSQGDVAKTNTLIEIQDFSSDGWGDIQFTNLHLLHSGVPAEHINIRRGPSVSFAGLWSQGQPSNKHVRIHSTVGKDDVRISNYFPVGSGAAGKALVDERAGCSLLHGVRHVPVEYTTGATAGEDATSLLGHWALNDAGVGALSGRFQIPTDAQVNRPLIVKVRWSADAITGNVRIKFRHDQVSTGDSSVTNTSEEELQSVAPNGTTDLVSETTHTGTARLYSQGDMVSVRFSREGASGADTMTGDMRVHSLDVLYERQL